MNRSIAKSMRLQYFLPIWEGGGGGGGGGEGGGHELKL
ncbi:uncharacterized protein METZ01_LOCUS365450 [marine metagenome]|uniref:Uncharacterized protein n=1 Tax=marine metagenome TaxID=408172 RepID=A0A382SRX3_9ZZZZ